MDFYKKNFQNGYRRITFMIMDADVVAVVRFRVNQDTHIRRDFVRIYDAYEPLRGWADEWVQRINKLFELNRERRKALGSPEEFSLRDQEVRQAVAAMAAVRDRELAAPPWLPKVAKKALKSLLQHWEGATVFVANPQIESTGL